MSFEYASWPMPNGVYAGWTTRESGYSSGVYAHNNVARHVQDGDSVQWNRQRLQQRLTGHPTIHWLNQTHSTTVVDIEEVDIHHGQDGVTTTASLQACNVMTADCLPVFLWSGDGRRIAAVHAGWRGLANGILAEALLSFRECASVYAGIGPAISQTHFEVGQDVLHAFQTWPESARHFQPGDCTDKFWCDLPGLAMDQLRRLGVREVYPSNLCSYADASRFYSYRRDGVTGRMANLIWKT